MEDLDWYINQAGDDIHMIETFGSDDAYDLYEALELDALAAPGAPPVVKGAKKLDVSIYCLPSLACLNLAGYTVFGLRRWIECTSRVNGMW